MSAYISVLLCILLTLTIVSDSAKILAVFSIPSISHQVVFRPVTLELAKRGHEVVVITTDPIFTKGKAPANYTEIDVQDLSYELFKKYVESASENSKDLVTNLKIAIEQILQIFKKQVLTKEVQNVLRSKQKFDLLFFDATARPALALSHILKVPTIQFSSLGALPGLCESVGAPTHFSLYPSPIRHKFVNLTFWNKVTEYYSNYLLEDLYVDSEKLEHEGLKEIFGSDIPPIAELRNNVDLNFLNINSMWDFNRPVPTNVIYLGSLHQNPPRILPKELQSYLDSSKNGVIYMSFGTNVKPSSLPPDTIRVFLKVFAVLPYNILWKWDAEKIEGSPSNVKISKWLPQSDLLQHPNIKLFITQGGLQSTDEAITAGVPLLGIPMLADQWYNTEMYLHHKIGLKLDMETTTKDILENAIKTIINDESYRDNIVKLRTLMRDQPQTSLERAVWWTEYLLRHGGAQHLRSPAANISWSEYLELELVFTLLITLLISIIAMTFLMKFLITLFAKIFFGAKIKTN